MSAMHQTRLCLFALLAMFLFATSSSGCDFLRGEDGSSMNYCESDGDCALGHCHSQLCAVPPEESYELAIQVIPSVGDAGRAPLSTFISPINVEDAHKHLEISLPEMARVSGRIRFDSQSVPSVISFTPASAAFGHLQRVEVETGDPLGDASVDFVASLIADLEYAVEIRPTSKPLESTAETEFITAGQPASRQLPPARLGSVAFKAGPSTFDYEYSQSLLTSCTDEMMRGCELRGFIQSENRAGEPSLPSDIEIRALEAESSRVISSVGIVRDGEFAIRLSEDAGEFRLQLSPATGGSPYRATVIDGPFTNERAQNLLIYRYPVVDYEAVIFSSEMSPVSGATVVFQTEVVGDPLLEGSTSYFRASTVSDEESAMPGIVSVQLQPGTFQVTVTPAASSEHGILVTEIVIPDDESVRAVRGQAFVLDKRASVEIEVDTFTGLPADNTDVQAVPTPPPPEIFGSDLARHARTSQGLTDADGYVMLPMDVGIYEILMRPGSHTGFPHALFRSVHVTHPEFTESFRLTIPAPALITGTLVDALGSVLTDATIRAYRVRYSEDGAPQLTRVGEAITDASGGYRLVLPSSPF